MVYVVEFLISLVFVCVSLVRVVLFGCGVMLVIRFVSICIWMLCVIVLSVDVWI